MSCVSSSYIASIIAGQQEGDAFLRSVNDCIHADALHGRIVAIVQSEGAGSVKLIGFARAIQKKLERTAAAAPRG